MSIVYAGFWPRLKAKTLDFLLFFPFYFWPILFASRWSFETRERTVLQKVEMFKFVEMFRIKVTATSDFSKGKRLVQELQLNRQADGSFLVDIVSMRLE